MALSRQADWRLSFSVIDHSRVSSKRHFSLVIVFRHTIAAEYRVQRYTPWRVLLIPSMRIRLRILEERKRSGERRAGRRAGRKEKREVRTGKTTGRRKRSVSRTSARNFRLENGRRESAKRIREATNHGGGLRARPTETAGGREDRRR